MTIQQCRYVLEIARLGSFSQAAKQLFVAQSSLSISVKSLEGELGIIIFERSSGGVRLTEAGSEFIKYAREIVESSDFLSERYSKPRAQKKLFIATQHYDFIADIFAEFLASRDDEYYKLSIREIETHSVIREVESAYSDIGIIAIKDGDYDIMRRYLSKRGLAFTPIIEAAPHVFFRAGHPLSGRGALSLSELKSYPYVSYEQGEHTSSFFTEEMMSAESADKHIEISDRATLMNVLLVTDAYTVGTGIMPSALNRGDIVSVPFESEEHYVIGYILSEGRKSSELTNEFITLLEKSLKEMVKTDEGTC